MLKTKDNQAGEQTLTERRAADRAQMAQRLQSIALECGAMAVIEDKPFGDTSPRMVMVRIQAAEGVRLHIDLDGDSWQPNTHVLSWCIRNSDERFDDSFCPNLNRYHFAKATDVAHGFAALCDILRKRLSHIASGEAFRLKEVA